MSLSNRPRLASLAVSLVGVGAVVMGVTACDPPDFALSVPSAYKSYFQIAAKRCPSVLTPESLAAQASTESGFNPRAVSPAGAQGLMQIIPEVWAVYGTDANGDGRADPFTPADSVATSAKYNCYLSSKVNVIGGDQTELRLAAYNAGLGAVEKYDGFRPTRKHRTTSSELPNALRHFLTISRPPVPASGRNAGSNIRLAAKSRQRRGKAGSLTHEETTACCCRCCRRRWGRNPDQQEGWARRDRGITVSSQRHSVLTASRTFRRAAR